MRSFESMRRRMEFSPKVKRRCMAEKLRSLKPEHTKYFTFADLISGGALAKQHVGVFTYFHTVETNDSFLEALNHAEASYDPNDGLCQNLARYSTTSLVDRKHYQAERDGGAEAESSAGKEGDRQRLHQ
eukprot:scaffold15609_cov55-Attheya_sp.AAC.8